MGSESGNALLSRDIVDSFFTNPLPGGENAWSRSTLGAVHHWPPVLKVYTRTLVSFTYPAALFWGPDLVLLHNHAWAEAGGIAQQGRPQRNSLSSETHQSLQAALQGGRPTKIMSHEILRAEGGKDEDYMLLVSPLFDSDSGEPAGLLAQLLPPPPDKQLRGNYGFPTRGSHEMDALDDSGDSKEPQDNVALDQHPFFHRFAEMVPCGIAILDHNAEAIFVNQHFFELTSHREDDKSFQSWPQSIYHEDYERVMNAYKEAFTSQKQLRTEFRASSEGHPWRLLFLNPLGDESLQHVSLREYGGFICSVVDITSEKSAEFNERRSAGEARRRKEQQEKFIDMISHEIRNPLSAVLHCSEDITEAIQGDPDKVDIEAIQDAIETIDLCIQHQQNIVNDVLSFSKLDSDMLSLSPRPAQPRKQIGRSLKMFQPEFRKQDIDFQYRIDTSYVDLDVQWVMADLARIGQVLVNLVTNAIKFTARKNGEKKILIGMGTSVERPTSYPPNVVFFQSEEEYHLDSTKDSTWGNGEILYCMIAVKDTGIGISDEGQKKLFERFHQATPKTEEMYGGSGLGLNIARKICHIHGGDIGVSSREGDGSTFGFFFKVRRAEPPEDDASAQADSREDEGQFADQMRAQGNEEPTLADESKMPTSLNDAPVRDMKEVSPEAAVADRKMEHTANIAKEVKENRALSPSNQHSHNERPGLSKANKSSGRLQSASITTRVKNNTTTNNANQSNEGAGPGSDKPHLLLVEDNMINQKILFRKLEKHGFVITTANNGEEAVDAVKAAPPHSPSSKEVPFDIILMDQEMPRLDGNGASRAIRELELSAGVPRIKILGVTANVRGEQQDEMRAAGMDDVISKPYKIEQMVDRVRGMIRKPQEPQQS